jgi:hypothetical protein
MVVAAFMYPPAAMHEDLMTRSQTPLQVVKRLPRQSSTIEVAIMQMYYPMTFAAAV